MSGYQKVYLRVAALVGDTTSDDDELPDRVLATGSGVLVPSLPEDSGDIARGPDGLEEIMIPDQVPFSIVDGMLTHGDKPYVWLPVPSSRWMWHIEFSRVLVAGRSWQLGSFSFPLLPATQAQIDDPEYPGVNLAYYALGSWSPGEVEALSRRLGNLDSTILLTQREAGAATAARVDAERAVTDARVVVDGLDAKIEALDDAYEASEAGQALPPRLTETALNATYQPVGSYVPTSALASTIRVEKGTLIDNGTARPDWPGIIDWWIPEGGPLPAHIASGDLVTEVATEPMPFVPTDLPGLFAWYSAAGAGVEDGQTTTTLPDLSAGGYPMSAAAGSALYDADGLNGTPALLVNGDTQFSTGSIGAVVESGQVLDLFVTGRTNTTSTAQHFVASANEIDIYHLTAATGWQARRNNSGGGANLSAGTSDTNPHIFHFHSDGANSYLSVDGAQVAAGTCGPAGTTELRMFGRTVSSNLLDGAIGDVLWVRGGIDQDQIAEMHQFLSARTGIAV